MHVWVHYRWDGDPLTIPTVDLGTTDEVVIGDDARSETVAPMVGGPSPGGYELAVLSKHPATGRLTGFPTSGAFTYQPPKVERVDEQFTYRLVAADGLSYASARVAAPALEMTIYDGQNGAAAIRERAEVGIGAVTVANLNDTDADGKPDATDGRVVADEPTTKGVNEVDLMKLVVKKPAMVITGPVMVEVKAGDAKLYNNEFAIHTGSHGKSVGYFDDQFTGPGNTITLWAEARAASQQLRDIEITMSYGGATETVKATAIWAVMTKFRGTGETETLVTAGTRRDVRNYRNTVSFGAYVEGRDGSLGTNSQSGDGPNGQKLFVNPVEMQFTVYPANAGYQLRVEIDVSRSVETALGEKWDGTAWQAIGTSDTLPNNRDAANDDSVDTDEISSPLPDDKLYSFDAPGIKLSAANQVTHSKVRQHLNGFEFIRVKFENNVTFIHPGLGNPSAGVQGSRMSELFEWHSWLYYEKQGGVWLRPTLANGQVDTTLNELAVGRKALL